MRYDRSGHGAWNQHRRNTGGYTQPAYRRGDEADNYEASTDSVVIATGCILREAAWRDRLFISGVERPWALGRERTG